MMNVTNRVTPFLLFQSLLVCAAIAQTDTQTPTQRNDPHNSQKSEKNSGASMDEAIAGCLLLGNTEEVAIARFGREHAQNEQVQQFAEMLIRDHEQAVTKLTQIAPELASSIGKLDSSGDEKRDKVASKPNRNETDPNQSERQSTSVNGSGKQGVGKDSNEAQGAGMQAQMFAMQQRATQECLQLTKQELGRAKGNHFDMAFMGSQIGCHIGMLAKLKASEHAASDNLKPILDEATQMVTAHLEQAREICHSLDKDRGDQTASNSGDGSRIEKEGKRDQTEGDRR